MSDSFSTIADTIPSFYDFKTSSPEEQDHTNSLMRKIVDSWGVVSISSVLPSKFLPFPEPCDWDVKLLSELADLAAKS